jgi:hypothetical protein
MSLDLGQTLSAGRPEPIRLTPLVRTILLGLMVALSVYLGAVMDVTILVAALGLLNVAIVVFLLLRRDIVWGFLFYLTAVIFFQHEFWIRLPGFPDLYPARIVAMLLYLIFLAQILMALREVPRFGAIEKAMIAFLVMLFISVVTSGQAPRWQMLMRGYLLPFMFFYFARAAIKQKHQVQILVGYLVLIGIYMGVMGVFEKLKWYELVFPKFIVDPNLGDRGLARLGFRVRGIFIQPAVLGTVMIMGFFPSMLFLSRLKGMFPRILQLVLVLVTPATLVFTMTRSVYLGFVGALFTGVIWSRRLRTMCTGLVLAGMVVVFLNWDNLSTADREKGGLATINTVHHRIELLYETAEVFADNPLFGCGFMNFPEVALQYRRPRHVPFFGYIDPGVGGKAVQHNMLATIFAEQGLSGFIPYLLIYFFIWRTSLKAYRRLPHEGLLSRDWIVCLWCAMVGYFLNAMFFEMRYFEYVNVLMFALMGTTVGMYERHVRDLPVRAAPEPRRRIPWPALPEEKEAGA